MTAEPKRKPVQQLRIGTLSASVWRQEGSNGRPFYNVTVQRAFKRDEASEWEHTDSFGRSDLLEVAKLLDAAHSWIVKREKQDKIEANEAEV